MLLEQIHKHASGRLEEGSSSRRRSLGGPASPDGAGPGSSERVGTIPFPARGNSIPAASSRQAVGDFPTTPTPAFDFEAGQAADGLDEAPAPSFSAAAAALWTCGACTLRNDAASTRCTACGALRGSEVATWL